MELERTISLSNDSDASRQAGGLQWIQEYFRKCHDNAAKTVHELFRFYILGSIASVMLDIIGRLEELSFNDTGLQVG